MLADLLEEMGISPMLSRRPRVGVSACLLGHAVRYNGETRYHSPTAQALARWSELREFCPEVGIGLPVPRPPIQVVQLDDGEHVRGVAQPEKDFTAALKAYADGVPRHLDGFVLKARSPSCGLESTPLFDDRDQPIGTTSGAFARHLKQRFPLMPLCDEAELEIPAHRKLFILRTWIHHQWRQTPSAPGPWSHPPTHGPLARALGPWLEQLAGATTA